MTIVGGLDVGFRKTGVFLVELGLHRDAPLLAKAIYSTPKDAAARYKSYEDIIRCSILQDGLTDLIKQYDVKAFFCEIPAGGSQNGRSARTMGLATMTVVATLRCTGIEYDLFLPSFVEETLGIKVPRRKKDEPKTKSAELKKEKKRRLRETVLREWPDFKGWPKAVTYAEDTYDAAAALLCARANSELYARLDK